MKIAIDATPAAIQRAGVGRYTRELLIALSQIDGSHSLLLASAADVSENEQLLRVLPPGVLREVRRLPLNPRATTIAWQRLHLPVSVESLIGGFDLFHGPDFVVPPSRRPRVVTIHDLSFLLTPENADPALVHYLTRAVPRSIDAADVVITVSASVACEVAEAYPGVREKLIAIPNGVRPPPHPLPRVAATRPEILAVGTIEPRKNLLLLLEAMPFVRSSHPDAHLTIAGRIGWQANETMVAIRTAERSGAVRFVESPSDDELEALYARATLVAFPSRYEGFGLPVLEAMSRDVPVVASDIRSLRETGGDAVVYVDPDNTESIAAAILRVIDDGVLRSRLVTLGRKRVTQFTWTDTAQRTLRAYRRAIGGAV